MDFGSTIMVAITMFMMFKMNEKMNALLDHFEIDLDDDEDDDDEPKPLNPDGTKPSA